MALAAVITDDQKLYHDARWRLRSRFDRQMADFVVYRCSDLHPDNKREPQPVVIIELDDSTHIAAKDRARDAIAAAAGVQTKRYESRNKPQRHQIAADVERFANSHSLKGHT